MTDDILEERWEWAARDNWLWVVEEKKRERQAKKIIFPLTSASRLDYISYNYICISRSILPMFNKRKGFTIMIATGCLNHISILFAMLQNFKIWDMF